MANDEEEQQDPNAYHSDSDSNSDSDSDSDSDYPSGYDSYSDAPGDYDEDDDSQKGAAFRNAFKFRRTDDDDESLPHSKNNPEVNFRDFAEVLDGPRVKAVHDEDDPQFVADDDAFEFPEDPENWNEEDLREVWADGPTEIGGTGWDPAWATRDEWEYVLEELEDGREPPIAPFYLPYRKHYPAIPDNHFDINSPQSVIEELDRIEEFLKWASYVFEDGSTYEGTLWDDYAHGKGVYVSKEGLVRYEGEWLQNDPEGHGVIEVDIPESEPAPGSKLEKKMRAQGKLFARDFMSPEDREWLEKDIEDSYLLADGAYEIPFYENDAWVEEFGEKPEKGRYRYAGQWKHGRMHGCGVYSVNERLIYGRFYFGEYVDEGEGCDDETSALHAGIAEVAAAKARMFVNKPDGMVREERGPYNDPQHPYFYEEEDVWMAPGFINQFYEVPDYWKMYVQEVDQEREMWLNSFYKAPLRLPMPAELEYWWANDKYHGTPEFVLINKEPEPDPEDPSRLIYTEDPLILHTPTGHLINYVEDEEHGIRLFWQPPLKKGEDVDPDKAHFLPLGYDEFFGTVTEEKKESIWIRLLLAIENACKPWFEKLDKWTEEQRQKIETRKKEIEEEIELIEAEVRLEEAIEQLDDLLRQREKEEEKKAEMGISDDEDEEKVEMGLPDEDEDDNGDDDDDKDEDEDDEEEKKVEKGSSTKNEKVTSVTKQDKKPTSATKQDEKATPVTKQEKATPVTKQDKKATSETKQDKKATSVAKQDEKAPVEQEEDWDDEGDEEEEDEDNAAQSSFGSVEQEQTTDRQKGKPGKSPFSTSSLAFASCSLITAVPSKLQQSISIWNKGRSKPELVPPLGADHLSNVKKVDSVSFRPVNGQKGGLKAVGQAHGRVKARSPSGGKFLEVRSLSKTRSRLLASADSKSNLKEPRASGVAWLHVAPERDLDSILSLHSSMCNFEEHRETVR